MPAPALLLTVSASSKLPRCCDAALPPDPPALLLALLPCRRRFKSGSVLTLKLGGSIAEQPQGRFSPTPSLPQLCECLRKAALDPRVKGLVVKVEPLGVGWGKLQVGGGVLGGAWLMGDTKAMRACCAQPGPLRQALPQPGARAALASHLPHPLPCTARRSCAATSTTSGLRASLPCATWSGE